MTRPGLIMPNNRSSIFSQDLFSPTQLLPISQAVCQRRFIAALQSRYAAKTGVGPQGTCTLGTSMTPRPMCRIQQLLMTILWWWMSLRVWENALVLVRRAFLDHSTGNRRLGTPCWTGACFKTAAFHPPLVKAEGKTMGWKAHR